MPSQYTVAPSGRSILGTIHSQSFLLVKEVDFN